MQTSRYPTAQSSRTTKPLPAPKSPPAIGKSLARDAVAVRVDGTLWDLERPITEDVAVEIVTRDSEAGLELLRHDAAHVLAER